MKRVRISAAAVLTAVLVCSAAVAAADCRLNGRNYPVGTVVGNLVCTDNGWAPRGR